MFATAFPAVSSLALLARSGRNGFVSVSSAHPALAEPEVLISSEVAGCGREGGLENVKCARGNINCCREGLMDSPGQSGLARSS